MGLDMAALSRPVGPLPLWGWGALAAGGAILLLARHGVPAAAAITNPTQAAPAPPGDTSTTPAAQAYPPMDIAPGSQVYDPGTGQTTPTVSLSDLLGGQSVSDFVGKLGPDYQNFQLQDGQLGVNVQHSAQNLVDSSNQQADLAYKATIGAQKVQSDKNLLDYANTGYAIYQGAYSTNVANELAAQTAQYQAYEQANAANTASGLAAQTAQMEAYTTAYTNNLTWLGHFLHGGA